MHALEMLRGLVLFGIADGAERVLGLERDAPQRVAAEGNGAIGEIAPVAVASVVQPGRMIQNEAGAFERDEAVGELVLDRLEFSDRLPELVTLLGVIHGQFERPPGCTICPRQQCDLGLEAKIVEISAFERKKRQRYRIQPHFAQTPDAHGARRYQIDPGSVELDEGKLELVDGHQKMCGTGRLDEAKHASSAPVVNADRAGARVRVAGAEAESGHRRADVQLFQQFARAVGC